MFCPSGHNVPEPALRIPIYCLSGYSLSNGCSKCRCCEIVKLDAATLSSNWSLKSCRLVKNYCHIDHSGDGISTLVDGVWQPALGTGNEALMSGNMRSKRQRNLDVEQYTLGIATKL